MGTVDDNDDDFVWLMLCFPLFVPILASFVVGAWEGVRIDLLERHLIAAPGEAVVEVPGWEGAGLAGVHIVVVSCALVTALVIATTIVEQQRRRTIDIEGWGSS